MRALLAGILFLAGSAAAPPVFQPGDSHPALTLEGVAWSVRTGSYSPTLEISTGAAGCSRGDAGCSLPFPVRPSSS